MRISYPELYAQCEAHAKAGQTSRLAAKISPLNFSRLPRQWRLPFAGLCRRAGRVSTGLRILSPIIRDTKRVHRVAATQMEMVGYAALLQRMGSVQEALSILSAIETAQAPEARFFEALCHIRRWDYQSSIPNLQEFVLACESPYMKFVGQVNLAAALAAIGNDDAALELSSRCIDKAKREGYIRLLANSLEIRAQALIHIHKFARAQNDLAAASEVLSGADAHDLIFIRKWQAIARAMDSGKTDELNDLRRSAWRDMQWEVCRDLDFHSLKVKNSDALLNHLVFGTPFQAYRERIRREIGAYPDSDSFLYGAKHSPTLDLVSLELSHRTALNGGKLIHQFIGTLVRDFYRPVQLGEIFAELFPGEYFDANSSRHRIQQVICRTRQWLHRSKIPAQVLEKDSSYRLRIDGKFSIRVPLEYTRLDTSELLFNHLKRRFPTTEFSAREASAALSVSRVSFQNLAKKLLSDGTLDKRASGRSVLYRIKP